MKVFFKKGLSLLLSTFIFISPLNISIYAQDTDIVNEEVMSSTEENNLNQDIITNNDETEDEDINTTTNDESSNINEEQVEVTEESQIDEEIKEDEILIEDKENLDQVKDDNEKNKEDEMFLSGDVSLINYFLIDFPYLETASTQNFVISFADGSKNITSMSLFYQKEGSDEEIELQSLQQQGRLFKFTQVFNEQDSGIYRVNKIHYSIDDKKYEINFNELQMDIKFGINQIYDGYENLVKLDQSNNIEELPEVISLDSSNQTNTENKIANVLTSINANSISTFQNQKGPLVIALDPGHGGLDSGMTTINGTFEKIYTLKIANYLKEELEQYNNVKVAMTRTDDSDVDLKERAKKASSMGASVLISLHLNAFDKKAYGAEVYYPNVNYRPDLSTEGKNVAQQIQNELVSLGIYDRGILIRDNDVGHEIGFDYPDNTIGDYYGIIRHSKNEGIAAIIVEHCFGDNQNDFNQFLSSEEKIKNLAIADANGIAKAYGLKKGITRVDIDNLARQHKNDLKDGTYEIQSALNTKSVIDVKDESKENGANVEINKSKGVKSQAWQVSHDGKGYVILKNVQSGKALDVEYSKAKPEANVLQYDYKNGYNQKWIVIKDGSSYKIASALDPEYVLDLHYGSTNNGSNIELYTSKDSRNQRWVFKIKYKGYKVFGNNVRYYDKNGNLFIGEGYTDKAYLKTDRNGNIKAIETINVPFYKQNDPRWAGINIGGYGAFSSTGCVPSVMTSIINYYKGTNYTPIQIGQLLNNNRLFNCPNTGAGAGGDAWKFISNYYGLGFENNMSKNDIVMALKQGKLVGILVDSSYYGHYGYTHQIMLTGIGEDGKVRVHDPLWNIDGWRSLDGILSHKSNSGLDCQNGGPIFAI